MRSRLLLTLFAAAGTLAAATPSELMRAIQENGLDPAACYRVRDFSFAKEDVRVYLNEETGTDGTFPIFERAFGRGEH